MVKTFTAQNVVSVNPLQFVFREGNLTQILVNTEVNYGEMGMNHTFDILPHLTDNQKERALQTYEFIRGIIEQEFLGEQ